MTPEFSRLVRIDTLGAGPHNVTIAADEAERAALAARFELVAIKRIEATLTLIRNGDEVRATGTLSAAVTQSCVATEAPVPAQIRGPVTLLFRPDVVAVPDEEMELDEDELDVMFYQGSSVDIGEGVAQTLLLALDPYPRSPEADDFLKTKGVVSDAEAAPRPNPFAALKDKI